MKRATLVDPLVEFLQGFRRADAWDLMQGGWAGLYIITCGMESTTDVWGKDQPLPASLAGWWHYPREYSGVWYVGKSSVNVPERLRSHGKWMGSLGDVFSIGGGAVWVRRTPSLSEPEFSEEVLLELERAIAWKLKPIFNSAGDEIDWDEAERTGYSKNFGFRPTP